MALAQPGAGGVRKTQARKAPASRAAKLGTAGQRIYLNPDTGEIGVPAPGQALGAPAGPYSARSTSPEGLSEVPAPRGGFMVDLQGQFRSTVTVRRKADGSIVTECVQRGIPVHATKK